jgi:hypothetical protein
MADVKHDHQVLGVVDLVQHSPVATQAGTADASQLRAERLANPPGIIEPDSLSPGSAGQG